MPQTNYTPILIYASGTTGNTPAAGNLTNSSGGSELAINYFDGKLFYKDASNVVRVLASRGTGTIGGSDTQVQFNSSGALAGSANLTFNGTSLTLGGNPTLSAGTANGVLYLNGSKVATSGSELTFTGATFANNGSTSVTSLQAVTSTNTAQLQSRPDISYSRVTSSSFLLDLATLSNQPILFTVNSAEQMRLTTTGLGIGTTNPTSRLQIESNTDANAFAFIRNSNTGTSSASSITVASAVGGVALRAHSAANSIWPNAALIASDATLTGGLNLFQSGASHIALWTNSTERMRLDSSGNLGLGVTPSAWLGSQRAFEVSGWSVNASAISSSLVTNGFINTSSSWIYKANGFANRHDNVNGQFQWHTAPSGTAGNAISFTQAMTLDANGNLGIGTTSPAFRLEVSNPNALPARFTRNAAGSNLGGLVLNQPNTTDGNSLVLRYSSDTTGAGATTDVSFCQIEFAADIHNQATRAGSIRFTTSLGGVGDNQERLRITSTGNQIATQPAESAQNANATLTVANLQTRIITSNAAVTLTLPTGTDLDTYATSMATNTAFECTFIATTANAITIAANGNTTVGSLTVAGNTSGTFRFRKTAANTFTVYRVA